MLNKNVRTSLRVPALAALTVGLAAASTHAAPASHAAHRASWGSRAAAPATSTSVILKLAPGGLTAARQAALARLGAGVTRRFDFIGSVAVTVPGRSLARVAALPFVTHLSSDGQVRKCDEFTVAASGAGAAYQQYGLTGAGVTVAVVDSGVQCNHWDLLDANGDGNSRVIGYADFVPVPRGSSGPNLYSDFCGHGTHVAGIIAGNGAAPPAASVPTPTTASPATQTWSTCACSTRTARAASARCWPASSGSSPTVTTTGTRRSAS